MFVLKNLRTTKPAMIASYKRKERRKAYLFIAPQMLLLFVLVILPVFCSFILSFCDWDFVSGFENLKVVGLGNYIEMWQDQKFITSFFNTLIFTAGVVPISMAISLLVAIALNKHVYAKGFLRLAFFVPYISSIVAVSIVWSFIFNPTYGPINNFLMGLGIENPPGWLTSSKWALPSLMIVSIWQAIGYCIVIYLGGLQNVPEDLYEAAKIDGANGVQQFFKITLPMLSPTTFFLLITRVIQSFQIFAPISVLTGGGPGYSTNVMVYYMYEEAFGNYRMGYASAVAWIMFAIIMVITVIQWRGQKKWVAY